MATEQKTEQVAVQNINEDGDTHSEDTVTEGEPDTRSYLQRYIDAQPTYDSTREPMVIDLYPILEAHLLTALGLSEFITPPPTERSVKRRRTQSGEEKNAKRRRSSKSEASSVFTADQKEILERVFLQSENPTAREKAAVAEETGLSKAQISKWFQNRRYRKRSAAKNSATLD